MEQLTIFYDGACHLCHREVEHYFKKDEQNKLKGVDISNKDFDAQSYGLDDSYVNLHMHAIDSLGKVYVGIDCFAQIWRRLPGYKKFAGVLEGKGLRPFLNFGYDIFARQIRPRLPKRNCDSGTCDIN